MRQLRAAATACAGPAPTSRFLPALVPAPALVSAPVTNSLVVAARAAVLLHRPIRPRNFQEKLKENEREREARKKITRRPWFRENILVGRGGGGARNVPWRRRRFAAVGTGHCCTGGSGPPRGRFIGEAVGGIRRFGRERYRVGAAARERGTRSRRRVDEIPPLPLGVGVLSRKAQDLLGKAPGSLTLARVPASAPRMVCLSMWILPSTEIFLPWGPPAVHQHAPVSAFACTTVCRYAS